MAGKPEQSVVSLDDRSLDRKCQEAMRRGSLSFYLASRLLPREQRLSVFRLYMWCRYCDDQIDQASLQGQSDQLPQILAQLREQTWSCFERRDQSHPVFQAFARLVRHHHIPKEYPMQLLEGMEMDIQGYHYRSMSDLLLYCYRVAGTVGLMSCHIFGIRDEQALAHADAMGRAMQLTNIARDIIDDASLARVYIPDDWFDGAALSPQEILQLKDRSVLVPLAARLIDEAERLYQDGEQGLIHLPWQCALAVSAARHIYSEIGVRVRVQGAHAWDTRTWIPTGRKLWLLSHALAESLTAIPKRLRNPWRPTQISEIRRPS